MYKDLLAGCFAGSSGVLLGHPLDTLKTRFQLSHQPSLGIVKILDGILKKEGFLTLYRGMALPLLSAGFLNSLLFSGYTITLRTIHSAEGEASKTEIIFASTVGALCQLIPAIPIELIKTKLQTQQYSNSNNIRKYSGPFDCALKIVGENGWIGLYRGGKAMFWRDIIGYLFYIPAYEHFRSAFRNNNFNNGKTSTKLKENIIELLSGGLAGSLSWWIICPFELIKNRLQAAENNSKIDENGKKLSEICRQIYAEGRKDKRGNWLKGIGGFYRGGSLLALRAFPVNACIFLVHSKCMQIF